MQNPWVLFQDLGWSSDWGGDEVGYPEYDVVGLYMLKDSDFGFYIEMESMRILEVLNFGEES